mmetsp:Transcript_31066/g.97522  ORF Transcript_31066/g.97522 Transcript_31066/m.97522 type:complete len:234 (+) Transcript_31066:329-1030(+)
MRSRTKLKSASARVLMRVTAAVDTATALEGQGGPPEEPAVGETKSPLAAGAGSFQTDPNGTKHRLGTATLIKSLSKDSGKRTARVRPRPRLGGSDVRPHRIDRHPALPADRPPKAPPASLRARAPAAHEDPSSGTTLAELREDPRDMRLITEPAIPHAPLHMLPAQDLFSLASERRRTACKYSDSVRYWSKAWRYRSKSRPTWSEKRTGGLCGGAWACGGAPGERSCSEVASL